MSLGTEGASVLRGRSIGWGLCRSLGLLMGIALTLACSGGRVYWDVGRFESRYPAVAEARGHRIGDLVPYVWIGDGELVGFVCRWEPKTPIRIAYADGVSAGEAELISRALELWEFAVPGIEFERVRIGESPHIQVSVGTAAEGFSGQTDAECAVFPKTLTTDGLKIEARLLEARVTLRRSDIDKLGRPVSLDQGEFLATAAHELGHALGFQGHAQGGSSIMRGQVGRVRGMGKKLLGGSSLREPSMQALYAAPSGAIVMRRGLPQDRTAPIARLASLAEAKGFRGPTVRVGDSSARLSWWATDGKRIGVTLKALRAAMRRATALEIEPDLLAKAWLGPEEP